MRILNPQQRRRRDSTLNPQQRVSAQLCVDFTLYVLDRNSGRSRRGVFHDYIYIGTPGCGFRHPLRRVHTGVSCERNASPNGGRTRLFSGPCLMPFGKGLRGIPETPKDIGVDFRVAANFTQNNQKKIAGCDTRTSHPAIAEHRKVRRGDFAPCDFLMSHLAISRYRTLPFPPVVPCDSKSPILAPEITPVSHRKSITLTLLRLLILRQFQHPRHSDESMSHVVHGFSA